MKKILLLSILLTILGITACTTPTQVAPQQDSSPTSQEPAGKLILYSGRSEPLIQPVIDAFHDKHPSVEILLKAGSNSELANALIEEKNNPQADIFITTELMTIQSLSSQGLFLSYLPQNGDQIPAELVGPQNQWVGLTRRARVIMYNTDLVSAAEAPQSIFELTDPIWKGQVAAAGSTNGSMQAQVSALRQLIGEQATEAWLAGLLENEITFFGGHTDVRKAVGAGEFKLGLVNHYYYYLQKAEGSPVDIVFPDQGEDQIGLITNVTAAAILEGSQNTTAAQAFLDFLLSPEGQALFARLNYEYPVLPGTPLNPDIQPLADFKFADVNIATAAAEFDATFDLIEKMGLP